MVNIAGKPRQAARGKTDLADLRDATRIAAATLLFLGLMQPPVLSLAGEKTPPVSARARLPMIVYDQEVGVSALITAASLQEVLQAFSNATGVEIVTSGSADETISLRFKGL